MTLFFFENLLIMSYDYLIEMMKIKSEGFLSDKAEGDADCLPSGRIMPPGGK